jgi:hypothetical protein
MEVFALPRATRPALLRGLEAVSKGNLALIEMVLAPVGG